MLDKINILKKMIVFQRDDAVCLFDEKKHSINNEFATVIFFPLSFSLIFPFLPWRYR